MIYTTLNAIREHYPCEDGWKKLLKHLGKTKADDKRLALTTVLKSNGIEDAIWCLRAVKGHEREIRLYAVWCARQVQHLMKDPRSLAALDVAERHANGLATDADLAEARAKARDAAIRAVGDAEWAAAWAAAWTTGVVGSSWWTLVSEKAADAEWSAAWTKELAAGANIAATKDAAAKAWAAARDSQSEHVRKVF